MLKTRQFPFVFFICKGIDIMKNNFFSNEKTVVIESIYTKRYKNKLLFEYLGTGGLPERENL